MSEETVGKNGHVVEVLFEDGLGQLLNAPAAAGVGGSPLTETFPTPEVGAIPRAHVQATEPVG